MNMKNKVELYLFPITIIFMFVGLSNLYLTFFYGNYLRIKYFLNTVNFFLKHIHRKCRNNAMILTLVMWRELNEQVRDHWGT